MVLLFEECYFERQNGEEFIDIAFDSLNTMLLPCPYLRRYIVIDGYLCLGFYVFSNIQVKTWIINENHAVWLPRQDILLTHLHITKYRWQMHQDRNNAHIGQIAVVLDKRSSNSLHQVATKETECRLLVNFFQ